MESIKPYALATKPKRPNLTLRLPIKIQMEKQNLPISSFVLTILFSCF